MSVSILVLYVAKLWNGSEATDPEQDVKGQTVDIVVMYTYCPNIKCTDVQCTRSSSRIEQEQCLRRWFAAHGVTFYIDCLRNVCMLGYWIKIDFI